MAHGYQIRNQEAIHFVTLTTVGWIDIFSYLRYKELLVINLSYCIKEKGLVIYAWVIMSNHLHIICQAKEGYRLSDILRDFKSYTAKEILKEIHKNTESRNDWMIHVMKYYANFNQRNELFQVWQQDNHPVELVTPKFIRQKLAYIHLNPIRAGIVDEASHYIYSSARDYDGEKGLLEIELLDLGPDIGYLDV